MYEEERDSLLSLGMADDEYDPLAFDPLALDQDEIDDGNPHDVIDLPLVREMPPALQRKGAFSPARLGGPEPALRALLDHNPARRPVLLAIIDWCRDGAAASAITERVNVFQRDNRSVYAPMTLCRMLEGVGALELEMPPAATPCSDEAAGVEYLEVPARVDPVWRATQPALDVWADLTSGSAFRDLILGRDSRYLDVYVAVMDAAAARGLSKADVEAIVDPFPSVQKPRRFGGHFIDILERADALAWHDHAWRLTPLGERMRAEAKEALA